MPFTVSHAAAALPFLRTPLPIAALVIGTMAPDLPYFLPLGVPRDFSHSLLGVVTVDLVVGALLLVAWVAQLRAPVLDYAPAWLRSRMPAREVASIPLVVVALIAGALTHLAIDTVTHEGSLDAVLPFMALEVGPYSVANYVHFVVSAIGAVILAAWVRRWVARTQPRSVEVLVSDAERLAVWAVLVVGFIVLFSAIWLYQLVWLHASVFDQNALFVAFCVPVGVFGVFALVTCAVWQRRNARVRV